MSKCTIENIVQSPYIFSESPNLNQSQLHKFLYAKWELNSHWNSKKALICGITGKFYLYSDLQRKIQQLSHALKSSNVIREREICLVWLPNSIEFPVVLLGIMGANCIASPFNSSAKIGELVHVLNLTEPSSIFTTAENLDIVLKLMERFSCLKSAIVMGETLSKLPEGIFSYEKLMSTSNDNLGLLQDENNNGDDTALIMYSSGTSGNPKAVLITHNNITTNLRQMEAMGDAFVSKPFTVGGEQERQIVALPLYHMYGFQVCLMKHLCMGSRLTIVPRFHHELITKLLKEEKPTTWTIAPPMLLLFNNSPEITTEDFSCVKSVLCSAAPIGESMENRFRQKFPEVKFRQAFGMTELGGAVLAGSYTNDKHDKPNSIGVLFPGVQAAIINPKTGKALGPFEPGELHIKSKYVMKGYLKNDEATAEMLTSDGWIRSGDKAMYDDDGCFFIVDRFKEIIKFKGFQISPSELEDVIKQIPEVEEAIVGGLKNSDDGDEVPAAVVVLREGSAGVNEDFIFDFVANNVSDYKKLRGGVKFASIMEYSHIGKKLRKDVIMQFFSN